MKLDLNTILTIISFICVIASIIGAVKSNAYAKKAKALLNRDIVKSSLGLVLEMKGYVDCIRNYKNPALGTKPPRGQNIENMINEQVSLLKRQFDKMINDLPPKYEKILTCSNKNQTEISKTIAHMLSNSDEVSNENLDIIDSYFLSLEKELKKADEQETNILN